MPDRTVIEAVFQTVSENVAAACHSAAEFGWKPKTLIASRRVAEALQEASGRLNPGLEVLVFPLSPAFDHCDVEIVFSTAVDAIDSVWFKVPYDQVAAL